MRIAVISLIAALSLSSPAPADYEIRLKESTINWSTGVIVARGRSSLVLDKSGQPREYHNRIPTSINKARIEAYQIAREKALENLIAALKSIRVEPDTTLAHLISDDTFAQKGLAELINRVQVKEYPAAFLSSRCEAAITMGDLIASLPYDFPANDFPLREDVPIATKYSSLIIDGRDLDILPMLFPAVYAEDGLEIYGRHYVDSRNAVRYGMVSYCFTEDEALRNRRAGDRPYFTTALKSIKGCPVIAERDVRKILSSPYTVNNLKKCRVIIILTRK
jgi:hypothetical protein